MSGGHSTGSFASDGETELIAFFDVRGRDGRNGADGRSFTTRPRGRGVHGRCGGNAAPAETGRRGGDVEFEIRYALENRCGGRISVRGLVEMGGRPPVPYGDSYKIGDDGYLFIDAAGGKGGDGGRGGNGQPGSMGARGRDATRYSHGTRGGPGGNGGDAGEPSDGADGGRGGNVTLVVHPDDLGLLMLVKGHQAGGDIGFAGLGGHGGKGGRGGPGGQPHFWTETRTTFVNGKTQTRVVFRSNPGGPRGPRGRNGRPSAYRARDGQPGQEGELVVLVQSDDVVQDVYPSPYDLELVTFDLAPEHEILEPDSLLSLDRIVVRNSGGMPTPENYTIRIYLRSDRWLLCDEVDLVMHRSLAPGETHTFEEHGLRLRLGDYVVDEPRNRPFRLKHFVSPRARLESGIGRPFRHFENGERLKIRFPVEMMAVTCLGSLAPGESTRVIWGVTNVGQETFDQKYLYRAIRSNLRLIAGDMDQRHVVFFDDHGTEFDLLSAQYSKPIGELMPGETRVVETRIGIRASAAVTPYQGFDLGVDVDLQRPKSSELHEKYRCVDYRKASIRVSERYSRQDDSRFLLIANQKTTVNDIEDWTQLADYFGSSLDVWDVSYYGFLDLVRAVDRDKSLLEQWRGMTIIIPNNYYHTPHGKTAAFSQLAKTQFLRAAADYNINFYVVGDSRTGGEEMLATSLIPIDTGKSPSQLKDQESFLDEVKRWNKFIEKSREMVGGVTGDARDFADVSLGAVHEFDITPRTFLFQPDKKWLERHARKLQAKLKKVDPLHRWIIVHRYDTGDSDTSWGFFRERQVGKLEVRRTLDSSEGAAVLYEVPGIDAIDPDFINSKENKHGLLLALKFEDKVDRFIRLVSERTFPRFSEQYVDRPLTDEEVRAIGSELVDAILVDIFNEQRVAREARVWGRSGIEALTPKLNYLAERSLNYGLTYRQMQENGVSLDLLYDLLANIRHMAEKSKTAWDSPWIITSSFKRGRAVSQHMNDRVDRIVTNIFGREPSWWDKMTSSNDDYDPFGKARKEDPEGIERQIADSEIEARHKDLRRRRRSLKSYTIAQDHPGLTYDTELLSNYERVMSGERYDRYVALEAQATRHRYDTETAVRQKRSDLLVPLATEQPVASEQAQVTATRQN